LLLGIHACLQFALSIKVTVSTVIHLSPDRESIRIIWVKVRTKLYFVLFVLSLIFVLVDTGLDFEEVVNTKAPPAFSCSAALWNEMKGISNRLVVKGARARNTHRNSILVIIIIIRFLLFVLLVLFTTVVIFLVFVPSSLVLSVFIIAPISRIIITSTAPSLLPPHQLNTFTAMPERIQT